MRLKRETLLHKLQQVSAGIAAREVIDQSSCFVFRDGKIQSFNGEIFCSCDYDCEVEGAVAATPLVNLLNKMADEEIDIGSKESELLIAGKTSRSGIRMNQEILLPVDMVEKAEDWHKINPKLSDALEVVQGSTSKDNQHFNLTCVHIAQKCIEACDGYQATRYNMKTGLRNECLIKGDTVKSLIGISMDRVSEGKNWIHFGTDGLQVSCRRWTEDYIDLDELIDFEGEKTTLPGGLAEAVDKAEIFSVDSASENLVLVQIKNNKLRLKGDGVHGWYMEQKRIEYSGRPLSFLIPPKLLSEVTKKTNDVEITKDRLKIDAGKFIFVACLGTVED